MKFTVLLSTGQKAFVCAMSLKDAYAYADRTYPDFVCVVYETKPEEMKQFDMAVRVQLN